MSIHNYTFGQWPEMPWKKGENKMTETIEGNITEDMRDLELGEVTTIHFLDRFDDPDSIKGEVVGIRDNNDAVCIRNDDREVWINIVTFEEIPYNPLNLK